MVATLNSAGSATSSTSSGKTPARVIQHLHYHQRSGQHQYQQHRWPGATPALVMTLLFCAGTFILFQVLVTRATVSHRRTLHQWAAGGGGNSGGGYAGSNGGESSDNGGGWGSARIRQLLGEASSDVGGGGVNGAGGGVGDTAGGPDGGSSAHPERRVLKSLKALDTELRALVYQPIPSVEKFTGDLMTLWQRLHNGSGGRGVTSSFTSPSPRLLPDCSVTPEPGYKTLRDFYSSNRSTNTEGHWQPAWSSDPLLGGSHSPSDCQAMKSVLILVPYRQRAEHMRSLLSYLHPILQSQKLSYTIVVGEQFGNETFNKAKLMNAAFLESMKLRKFDCVIFHDVDLLPTNPFVPYHCPVYPRHISVSIDKFGYSLPYKQLVGGVLAMPVRHFLRVNGYSNLFWGWGGEDDDMETRIRTAGLLVTRPHPKLARYRMIRHQSRKEILGEVRYKLLYLSSKRYRLDGLNSLNYSLIDRRETPLFTHFLINLGPPPRSASFY